MLDNKDLVMGMCRVAANELGIRAMLLSPTMKQIDELGMGPKEDKLLSTWKEQCRVTVNLRGKGKHLKWPDILKEDRSNRKIAEDLYAKHYLDLRLPYDFYVSLNEARFRYHLKAEEHVALSLEATGETDKYNKVVLSKVKARIRDEVHETQKQLRENLYLTTTLNKKQIAQHTFYDKIPKGV
jgi:hypothetical protein